MKPRISYPAAAPGIYTAMDAADSYLVGTELPEALRLLVKLRASQLNGCAYCIDMHWKDLRVLGEPEQRLYGLDAWREAPYYTDAERAALAWTEAITFIAEEHDLDALHEDLRGFFSAADVANLTFEVATINSWNRLSIAARLEAGRYVPEPVAAGAQ